ncbi:hypothetical protein EVAR_92872_1 [Eumeta japonica]|uniref:Uncharacterized protein n=1 Tax=Eumeta variegata TaxID=151549 RepID=A0A4C1TB40_EUMVA|nr:hypothetical protein EVAR_92872_1 [Eumeta japonica]
MITTKCGSPFDIVSSSSARSSGSKFDSRRHDDFLRNVTRRQRLWRRAGVEVEASGIFITLVPQERCGNRRAEEVARRLKQRSC